MATNGYGLTETMCRQLEDLRIRNLQITLDGPRDVHDGRRVLRGGGKTYDRIVENIITAARFANVVIRVNVDEANYPDLERLLGELRDAAVPKDSVRIFCRPIVACGDESGCLNYSSFGELEIELIRLTQQYGFAYSFHPNAGTTLRCPAYHTNSWVIGPEGDCYRCPAHVSNGSKPVARLRDTGRLHILDSSAYTDSILGDPFLDPECTECKILPMCGGKCYLSWDKEQDSSGGNACIPERKSIEQKIRYLIDDPRQRKQFSESQHGR
jgi:uncharacterized protein